MIDTGKAAGWYTDDARIASWESRRLYTEGPQRTVVVCEVLGDGVPAWHWETVIEGYKRRALAGKE